MHCLLVSAQHHPADGGIGAAVAAFTAAASGEGWRVDLVTRGGDPMPPAAGVHVVETPDERPAFRRRVGPLRRIDRIRPYRQGLWSLAVARKLLEIDVRPDVIEFVDAAAEGVVALSSRRVRERFAGVPMIVHAHTPLFVEDAVNGQDPSRFGRPLYHRWERRALRAADGVIVTSRRLAERLGRSDAAVIPYPLVALPDAGLDDDRDPGDERIVLVGTVQPRKGVDTWARSLGRVLRARPRARAELIGRDTPTGPGGGSMADYARSCVDAHVRHRFRWLGALPHDAVIRALRAAALVVAPGRFDSFGLAAAEAMLLARPVVVSDRTGLAEVVPDVATFRTGDADGLAAAQLRVLEDPPAALRRAAALRRVLLEHCHPRRHLERRQAFVRSIAASRRRPLQDGRDTIDRMHRYLEAVESAERTVRVPHAGAPAGVA